jgi:1,4-dihydroxy-2-naphthoate octaprenyltransferase
MKNWSLPWYIALFKPLFLAGGILFYSLGVGISHYLGNPIDWEAYWVGLICVILLQLLMIFLKGYFDIAELRQGRNPAGNVNVHDGQHLTRQPALVGSLTILTLGAAFTVILQRSGKLSTPAFILLSAAFMLAFLFSAPPLRLARNGYGELVEAFLMANLVPALAFALQTGEIHRLLAMSTFPLTSLYLSMCLALAFPHYAADLKLKKPSLLIWMGWQHGMILHNLFIASGFLLLVIAILFGLPWLIAWPCFLALPVGFFQIWQMAQIAEGSKPSWRLLTMTAIFTLGLPAYFLAFGFWTR